MFYRFLLAFIILIMSLSAVRVARNASPTAAVIVFHGLGDSGQGWKFLADIAHRSPDFNHIKFIFPNAPIQPVTANGGHTMPSWFDILRFGGKPGDQDVPGYLKTLKTVDQYVKEATDVGIPTERIIIGGFSQGGGLALGKLVSSSDKYAGILALSPMIFPFLDVLKDQKQDINLDTPVFHGHGEADPMIPQRMGDHSAQYLKDLGYKNYDYKTYPNTGHSVAQDELEHILDFIKEKLPTK